MERLRSRGIPLRVGLVAATLVLVACGGVEVTWRRAVGPGAVAGVAPVLVPLATAAVGGIGALVWVALKVGALSYGGGFVIIPLMQADAVNHYHWMTSGQFLNAVALGFAMVAVRVV